MYLKKFCVELIFELLLKQFLVETPKYSSEKIVVITIRLFISDNLMLYSSTGDYDKLWAAATGGRGTGRGRKKKRPRGVDPELLKFGKIWYKTN